MTVIGDTFRKSSVKAKRITDGPTKFQLMLAVFDGHHVGMNPRLYGFGINTEDGHSFQAHIYGITFEAPYWILEGVDGHWGMDGLVKHHSFIAQYDTEKKKGYIKFLD